MIHLPFNKKIRSHQLMAIAVGLIYFWFGALKFFPFLSPADTIAKITIHELSFGILSESLAIKLLAVLECTIGLLLILNQYRKKVLLFCFFHMVCTFSPLILFPEQVFSSAPLVPKLLGQYIAKNIVLISVFITLWQDEKKKTNFVETMSV